MLPKVAGESIYRLITQRCMVAGINELDEVERCLRWAIGIDWDRKPVCEWPERVRRIGLDWSEDIDLQEAIDSIIEKWKSSAEDRKRMRAFAHAMLNYMNMEPLDEPYEKAINPESTYRKAIELLEQACGPHDPEVVMVMLGLFMFYRSENRHTEAEAVAEKMLDIMSLARSWGALGDAVFEELISFFKEIGKTDKAAGLEALRASVANGDED